MGVQSSDSANDWEIADVLAKDNSSSLLPLSVIADLNRSTAHVKRYRGKNSTNPDLWFDIDNKSFSNSTNKQHSGYNNNNRSTQQNSATQSNNSIRGSTASQ